MGTYRTQQLTVRKNDEYQALGHQIATAQGQIGELEEKELQLMYAIDEAKKKFVAAEKVLKENISGYEHRIRSLRERAVSLAEELKAAQAESEAARGPVPVPGAAGLRPAARPRHAGRGADQGRQVWRLSSEDFERGGVGLPREGCRGRIGGVRPVRADHLLGVITRGALIARCGVARAGPDMAELSPCSSGAAMAQIRSQAGHHEPPAWSAGRNGGLGARGGGGN